MNNSLTLTTKITTITSTAKELRNLKNSELDLRIKSLARQERELLTQVLHVIKEIDNRRLYLELSYSSLFAYLTESVGYSAASAQRRIDASRLLNEIPALSEKIENGEIHLTQASMIQKAAREIKRTRQMIVSTEDKLDLLSSLSGKNQRETEIQVAQYFDMPIIQKSIERSQADDSVRLEITLSKSQYEKLKQAQALLSHAVPSNHLADFIEYVSGRVIKQKTGVKNDVKQSRNLNLKINRNFDNELDAKLDGNHEASSSVETAKLSTILSAAEVALKSAASIGGSSLLIDPATKVVTEKAELSTATSLSSDTSAELASLPIQKNTEATKGFPLGIKKKILSRHSSCQYRDPKSDKLCGSTWFLQIDHKHSLWAGGNNELKNATVLCSQHNNLKYSKEAQIKVINKEK